MSAPDLDRAALVLTALIEGLTSHLARSRSVLEALRDPEGPTADAALSDAESGVEQLEALGRELDVYWPAGPDGHRDAGDRSAELDALCDQVAGLCAEAGQLEELQCAEVVARLAATADGMRDARKARRTETRYRGRATPPDPGLMDVRT
jgi:hypothetical protein